MFDDFDFFTGTEGTRRLRIFTGLIGAVIGGFLGYFYSTVSASAAPPSLAYGFGGAAVGGFFGAIFSAWVLLGVIVVAVLVGVFAYQWLLGGS